MRSLNKQRLSKTFNEFFGQLWLRELVICQAKAGIKEYRKETHQNQANK